jgi:negative regulator of genetic competence, sporulation and motility
MSLIQKYKVYICLLFTIFALGCKNDNNHHYDQKVENEYSENTSDELPSDCDELLEFIQNEGDRIRYIDDSDMNSTALNNVSLYEYDGIYYVVIRFQDENHEYIYCDIDLSYWNKFVDNDEDSFGRGYQNWIRPYTSCDCGR